MISLTDNKTFGETLKNKIELVLNSNAEEDIILNRIYLSLSDPLNPYITNKIFTKNGIIKINGQINFELFVMNLSCVYENSVYKQKKSIIQINNLRFFGVKVYDIFRMQFEGKIIKDQFENDKANICNKILKKIPDDNMFPILGYISPQNFSLVLIDHQTKLNYTIDNFANHIILFPEFYDWYSLFRKNIRYPTNFDVESFNILNKMTSHINKSLIQSIINIFYFNQVVLNEISTVIEFDEPRSLLSIMEEFHTSRAEYFLLRKMVKENDDHQIMIFDNVENFCGKNSEIIPLENFDKIYFKKWDTNNSKSYDRDYPPVQKICSIINNKYLQKRKKNHRNYNEYNREYRVDGKQMDKKENRNNCKFAIGQGLKEHQLHNKKLTEKDIDKHFTAY